MKNQIGRLCDTGAKHGADVTIRTDGHGLSCVFECPRCGRTLAGLHVTGNGRIMFGYRTRIRTTRSAALACAIIERTLGKEHECATYTPPSPTELSPSH
ncbi:hypothetical protein BP742P1_00010 [Bifidobacterium phage BP742P1]|nr:hypothetical protein BP742P1_00010 [Bifidobacterium phage BP742P1]